MFKKGLVIFEFIKTTQNTAYFPILSQLILEKSIKCRLIYVRISLGWCHYANLMIADKQRKMQRDDPADRIILHFLQEHKYYTWPNCYLDLIGQALEFCRFIHIIATSIICSDLFYQ